MTMRRTVLGWRSVWVLVLCLAGCGGGAAPGAGEEEVAAPEAAESPGDVADALATSDSCCVICFRTTAI